MPKSLLKLWHTLKRKVGNIHSRKCIHFTPAACHVCTMKLINVVVTVSLRLILMLLHHYTVDAVIVIIIFPDSCVSSYHSAYHYHTRINVQVRIVIILINISMSNCLFITLFLYQYCTPSAWHHAVYYYMVIVLCNMQEIHSHIVNNCVFRKNIFVAYLIIIINTQYHRHHYHAVTVAAVVAV